MGLTVAKLTAETRSFTWHYLDEEVPVTYKPGVLTVTWANGLPVAQALAQALVSIDITNGDGKPIALDEDTLNATLTQPVMQKIAQAIYDDATVDPTTAETSDAS